MESDDFCAFMIPFFSPSAFTGYGDDEKGFYNVYQSIFNTILKKEQYFHIALFMCRSIDESIAYPPFGKADDSCEVVLHFYSEWSSFTTRLSFAAADQYKTQQVYL